MPRLAPAALSALILSGIGAAVAAAGSGTPDFAREIRPLLAQRCFACHGPGRQDGGLRLDLRSRAMDGGDGGPSLLPGKPEESELLKRLVTADPKHRMPLGGKPLAAGEVERLRAWIAAGAPWPDSLAGRESYKEHWAFRPIKLPRSAPIRNPQSAIRNPIDLLVQPGAPEADRRTLIRRLALDLIGLPPPPEAVDAFVADTSPDAYERLVDRHLASPHFGERWGRHWLDLARFAESDGYENDRIRPEAWRYRDWVINALNRDLPFDQFTVEQLAGDLLPNPTPDQRIATGFHRNTLWNSAASADKEEFRTYAVKDRTDTTATAWMGLTAGCAKCHSHKYDPLTQREYYQLYAFFNNTDEEDVSVPGGKAQALRAVERPTYVHLRGNFLQKGEAVRPGVPAFLPALKPRGETPDRLDLARWLTDPRHPLTARVTANWVWGHLFGEGLAPTPENFGLSGQPPTHPELLDWLAYRFARGEERGERREGTPWSTKGLIGLIVTSAAYKQAATGPPEQSKIQSPESKIEQRRVRVEAEIVRDLALSVSGLLDLKMGGPSIVPPFPEGLLEQKFTNEALKLPGEERYRRGVYVHVQRTLTHPTLAAFDVADGNQACVRRDRSTTPIQALTLLNDPVYVECARALGARLRSASDKDEERIRFAFRLCLSRPPSAEELQVMRDLAGEQRRLGAAEEAVWAGIARTLLNLEEFITRE